MLLKILTMHRTDPRTKTYSMQNANSAKVEKRFPRSSLSGSSSCPQNTILNSLDLTFSFFPKNDFNNVFQVNILQPF